MSHGNEDTNQGSFCFFGAEWIVIIAIQTLSEFLWHYVICTQISKARRSTARMRRSRHLCPWTFCHRRRSLIFITLFFFRIKSYNCIYVGCSHLWQLPATGPHFSFVDLDTNKQHGFADFGSTTGLGRLKKIHRSCETAWRGAIH